MYSQSAGFWMNANSLAFVKTNIGSYRQDIYPRLWIHCCYAPFGAEPVGKIPPLKKARHPQGFLYSLPSWSWIIFRVAVIRTKKKNEYPHPKDRQYQRELVIAHGCPRWRQQLLWRKCIQLSAIWKYIKKKGKYSVIYWPMLPVILPPLFYFF